MQEQGWLCRSSHDVAPEDDPVEQVQLAGEDKRIKYEGRKTEDIKMDGTRSGPPTEQDIQPDQQVKQCDEPQTVVDITVFRHQDDGDIQAHARARNRIRRLAADPSAENLPLERCDAGCGVLVDRCQQVSGLDTGALPGTARQHLLRYQSAIALSPPDTVGGKLKLVLVRVVDGRENDRCQRQNCQDDCGNSEWYVPRHLESTSFRVRMPGLFSTV